MIAYIDESFKDGTISVGIYLSKGFDKNLRDHIARLYSKVWRTYGLNNYNGELKFHKFIHELGRRGIILDQWVFTNMLQEIASYLGNLGFIFGITTKNIRNVKTLEPNLHKFLTRLGIRRTCIEKFLLIWIMIRTFRIHEIVFDSGFQISKECLKRIFNALKISAKFSFKSSIATPGLEIADFVAGITNYVSNYNISILWLGNCRILRIQ